MMRLLTIVSTTLLLLAVHGCVQWKSAGLYDQPTPDTAPNIAGFTALNVFSDQLSGEVWFTPASGCLDVSGSPNVHSGNGALDIRWNKQFRDCPWLGLGIGWNNWSGKNFEAIIDSAALTFFVRNLQGTSKGLPWAVGFEDYEGGQAWTGVFPGSIEGGVVAGEWTKVTLPLADFPFAARDVNVTAIKQVVFQFEASGHVLVDHIAIERYKAPGAKLLRMHNDTASFTMGPSKWKVGCTDDSLLLHVEVQDDSPASNGFSGKDIWNGDALEWAFATLPMASGTYPMLFPTDRHLGWKCTDQPMVWDWSRDRSVPAFVSLVRSAGGYTLRSSVAWKDLGVKPFVQGIVYASEFALDEGTSTGRNIQYRWNSAGKEGFHTNPQLWGKLIVE